MTPSAPTVGSPESAPLPADFATPSSTVPLGVFVPAASVALPPLPPPPPNKSFNPSNRARGLLSNLLPRMLRLNLAAAVAPLPINLATAAAASTSPPPLVLPSGAPFLRMTDVSASEPHKGLFWSVKSGSYIDWEDILTLHSREEYRQSHSVQAWSRHSHQ